MEFLRKYEMNFLCKIVWFGVRYFPSKFIRIIPRTLCNKIRLCEIHNFLFNFSRFCKWPIQNKISYFISDFLDGRTLYLKKNVLLKHSPNNIYHFKVPFFTSPFVFLVKIKRKLRNARSINKFLNKR